MLRKTLFTIDTFGVSFVGYTADERWNGWAVPYFTKEVADKVVEHINNDEHDKAWYDEENDKYAVLLSGSDEVEEFPREESILGVDLYSIGGYSWVWDEVEPYELSYEEFDEHLEKTIKECRMLEGYDAPMPVVRIELNGAYVEIPMNADLYASLGVILQDKIEYKNMTNGGNK